MSENQVFGQSGGQYAGRGNKSETGLANAPETECNALKREIEGRQRQTFFLPEKIFIRKWRA